MHSYTYQLMHSYRLIHLDCITFMLAYRQLHIHALIHTFIHAVANIHQFIHEVMHAYTHAYTFAHRARLLYLSAGAPYAVQVRITTLAEPPLAHAALWEGTAGSIWSLAPCRNAYHNLVGRASVCSQGCQAKGPRQSGSASSWPSP